VKAPGAGGAARLAVGALTAAAMAGLHRQIVNRPR